jgi:quercetin dioxygenase-like cupin family protein
VERAPVEDRPQGRPPLVDVPPIDRQVRRDVGAAAESTDFGSVQWAVREGDPPGAEQTIGLATFDAGKGNAEHMHPNCEEVVFVLEGEVEHTLGDQSAVLRAGDLIAVPRDVPHRLINRGDAPVRALIVFSSPDRQFVPTGARRE